MKIETSDGKPLRSLADWQAIHKPAQWKPGRSAYSVADFIVNRDGARHLSRRVSAVLGESVEFHIITPELEVRFDRYGKGRFHDLGIRGETESGESIFVGVEAKVDEPFGAHVSEEWRRADTPSKRNRISQLCARFKDGIGISPTDEVKYQLMHGAAGTVEAGADVSVFYIAVFATDDYDEEKGDANFQDYQTFLTRAAATPPPNQNRNAKSHTLNLSGKKLTTIYEYFSH